MLAAAADIDLVSRFLENCISLFEGQAFLDAKVTQSISKGFQDGFITRVTRRVFPFLHFVFQAHVFPPIL
jgi:hypothetical protein